eukprot:3521235-Prymnesium_polylepis.1
MAPASGTAGHAGVAVLCAASGRGFMPSAVGGRSCCANYAFPAAPVGGDEGGEAGGGAGGDARGGANVG